MRLTAHACLITLLLLQSLCAFQGSEVDVTDEFLQNTFGNGWYDDYFHLLSEAQLRKSWSSDDGSSFTEKISKLQTTTPVTVFIDVILVGFDGDGHHSLVLSSNDIRDRLQSVIGPGQGDSDALRYMYRVTKASVSTSSRVEKAIHKSMKSPLRTFTTSDDNPSQIHLIDATPVHKVIANHYANAHSSTYTLYLLNPRKIPLRYGGGFQSYRYKAPLADPADGVKREWRGVFGWNGGEKRFVWADISAGPFSYGPAVRGDGLVTRTSLPDVDYLLADAFATIRAEEKGLDAFNYRGTDGRELDNAEFYAQRRLRAGKVQLTVEIAELVRQFTAVMVSAGLTHTDTSVPVSLADHLSVSILHVTAGNPEESSLERRRLRALEREKQHGNDRDAQPLSRYELDELYWSPVVDYLKHMGAVTGKKVRVNHHSVTLDDTPLCHQAFEHALRTRLSTTILDDGQVVTDVTRYVDARALLDWLEHFDGEYWQMRSSILQEVKNDFEMEAARDVAGQDAEWNTNDPASSTAANTKTASASPSSVFDFAGSDKALIGARMHSAMVFVFDLGTNSTVFLDRTHQAAGRTEQHHDGSWSSVVVASTVQLPAASSGLFFDQQVVAFNPSDARRSVLQQLSTHLFAVPSIVTTSAMSTTAGYLMGPMGGLHAPFSAAVDTRIVAWLAGETQPSPHHRATDIHGGSGGGGGGGGGSGGGGSGYRSQPDSAEGVSYEEMRTAGYTLSDALVYTFRDSDAAVRSLVLAKQAHLRYELAQLFAHFSDHAGITGQLEDTQTRSQVPREARGLQEVMSATQQQFFVRHWNIFQFKMDKTQHFLSINAFSRALQVTRSADNDLHAMHALVHTVLRRLQPVFWCDAAGSEGTAVRVSGSGSQSSRSRLAITFSAFLAIVIPAVELYVLVVCCNAVCWWLLECSLWQFTVLGLAYSLYLPYAFVVRRKNIPIFASLCSAAAAVCCCCRRWQSRVRMRNGVMVRCLWFEAIVIGGLRAARLRTQPQHPQTHVGWLSVSMGYVAAVCKWLWALCGGPKDSSTVRSWRNADPNVHHDTPTARNNNTAMNEYAAGVRKRGGGSGSAGGSGGGGDGVFRM